MRRNFWGASTGGAKNKIYNAKNFYNAKEIFGVRVRGGAENKIYNHKGKRRFGIMPYSDS